MKCRLFFLLFIGLIALFADPVLLESFFAACMRTLLALSNRFVATIVSVLLAFFAKLMLFVCLYAAFVVACLAFGFCLHAAALTGESGAGAYQHCKGKSCKRLC